MNFRDPFRAAGAYRSDRDEALGPAPEHDLVPAFPQDRKPQQRPAAPCQSFGVSRADSDAVESEGFGKSSHATKSPRPSSQSARRSAKMRSADTSVFQRETARAQREARQADLMGGGDVVGSVSHGDRVAKVEKDRAEARTFQGGCFRLGDPGPALADRSPPVAAPAATGRHRRESRATESRLRNGTSLAPGYRASIRYLGRWKSQRRKNGNRNR